MPSGWKSSYFRYRELFLNVSAMYKKRADLRAFLEIVLSLVTVIVFLMFALKPTALTIISLVKQINDEKQVLTALNLKYSNLQKANSLLAQNGNYLKDINMAVSSSPNPEVLAKQVLGLAARDGVTLIGFSVNDIVLLGTIKVARSSGDLTPLPEKAYEMGYSISVKGSFEGIDAFLKDLENLRVVGVVDSVSINSSLTDAGRVIVAVISGRVPFLGDIGTVTGAAE